MSPRGEVSKLVRVQLKFGEQLPVQLNKTLLNLSSKLRTKILN